MTLITAPSEWSEQEICVQRRNNFNALESRHVWSMPNGEMPSQVGWNEADHFQAQSREANWSLECLLSPVTETSSPEHLCGVKMPQVIFFLCPSYWCSGVASATCTTQLWALYKTGFTLEAEALWSAVQQNSHKFFCAGR